MRLLDPPASFLHNSYPFYIFAVPLGSIPELPAETCKEIKLSEGHAVSGKYWLNSIVSGKSVLAQCDMETEGKLNRTQHLSIVLPAHRFTFEERHVGAFSTREI